MYVCVNLLRIFVFFHYDVHRQNIIICNLGKKIDSKYILSKTFIIIMQCMIVLNKGEKKTSVDKIVSCKHYMKIPRIVEC